MALLLPANLMDPDGVVGRMVGDIDEADWGDVQILGWMYQYYNAEVKDAFFASKAKETPDTIGPATQLFTPDWIVRYMVQNSLGRLWMLNNPGSALRDQMEYYIEPDAEHEDFVKIEGPEDITLCDPACGSAHILVYAFELLVAMYRERGYRDRDIPELILTKNLAGMEIDPRAAQIAGLALAMRARELDRRFFRRGVRADIAVLRLVTFEEGELPEGCALAKKRDLLDALAHLDEVGSLLCPDRTDLAAIREAIALCGDGAGGLFAATAASKLERALGVCEKLARSFDCVVANPPYMGSSSFGPFMSKWVKKSYPDVKSDLCTCFISRIFSLTEDAGLAGLATSNSWMFLSSYENLRQQLVSTKTIDSLVQLSVHGFHGIAAQVCTFVLRNKHVAGYRGGYIRLNDFDHWSLQEGKALEAIQNPDCGWFYRRDAETFKQIPGTPIAYWALNEEISAFHTMGKVSDSIDVRLGMTTADNNLFLRRWWEPSNAKCTLQSESPEDVIKWCPYNKGGDFRKWYGNRTFVINWENGGEKIRTFTDANGRVRSTVPNEQFYCRECLTWSKISSGRIAVRFLPKGSLFDVAGASGFASRGALLSAIGFLNSEIAMHMLSYLSPTLNFEGGTVRSLPFENNGENSFAGTCVKRAISISCEDWDSFETSWDFKRSPLV